MTEPYKYYRKVIHIKAEDSPNVIYALLKRRAGVPPPYKDILAGLLSFDEYMRARATWDPVKQCVGLDGKFWKGENQLLAPPHWLDGAEDFYNTLRGKPRVTRCIGVDVGEYTSETCATLVDEHGVIETRSFIPDDVDYIWRWVRDIIEDVRVDPANVMLDRGGGGLGQAASLRSHGYPVTTVGFGDGINIDVYRLSPEQKRKLKEQKSVYKNMRAYMYGRIRDRINPATEHPLLALDGNDLEMRRQLALTPIYRDDEGKITLPPKGRKTDDMKKSNQKTMREILGCSPDRSDSLAVALEAYARLDNQIWIGVVK